MKLNTTEAAPYSGEDMLLALCSFDCIFLNLLDDSTRLALHYTSNKLRKKLLPYDYNNQKLAYYAALTGNVHLLQSLSYLTTTKLAASAARGGHMLVVHYLSSKNCKWDVSVFSAAADGGHVQVLDFYSKRTSVKEPCICLHAARAGSIPVLAWTKQHNHRWGEWLSNAAAKCNQLDALEWLIANGCPYSETHKKLIEQKAGKE